MSILNRHVLRYLLCPVLCAGSVYANYSPGYGAIHGNRHNNTEEDTWDVGWGGGKDFPEGIKGVYVIDFSKDGKPQRFTGKREFTPGDFGQEGKGLPVPRLGISVDIRIEEGATGDWRQKIFADTGRVVHEGWRQPRYRSHRRVLTDVYRDTYRFLDSRKLDNDSDGFWSAEVLREIDTHDVPAELDYAVIIPATWFDVPAPAKGEQYKTLRFDYLGVEGRTPAEISLREDYFNPDGSLRIGFVHFRNRSLEIRQDYYVTGGVRNHKVYVVQSNGKDGIIIARIDTLKGDRCLQIVQSTLEVSGKGESIQPAFGKKISYYQMESFSDYYRNSPEFKIFGYSKICNTLTVRTFRSFTYPFKLMWDDPYVRRRAQEGADRWQYLIDTCAKYGVDFAFEMHPYWVSDFTVHHPDLVAEYYDKKTGSFRKVSNARTAEHRDVYRLDAECVRGRALMEKYWEEFYSFFRTIPIVENVEMAVKGCRQKGRFRIGEEVYCYGGPFYSPAALESYRDFVGDPQARFPVPPGEKETARTFCTEQKSDWDKYRAWIIDAYTEGGVMAMMRGAYKALGKTPGWKGYSYMQGAYKLYDQTALLDMRKIISYPGLYWFVNEHGWINPSYRKTTREYVALVKKHDKKQVLLVNAMKGMYGGGPGELPKSWSRGYPGTPWWKPAEMLWIVDKIFGFFPSLDGWCWHAGFAEESYRFWTAYQTVEWDRGLMPIGEAGEIVDEVRDRYNRYRAEFDYDQDHVFKKVRIQKAGDFGEAPEHEITAAEGIFRGTLNGNETTGASFRIITDGKDKVQVLVEVTDDVYAADPKKYSFPIGKGWAWKDKVDIYLGFAKHQLIRVRGVGGFRPPPDRPRYTHTLGASERTGNKGNTIWVEARCGEELIACYSYNSRKAGEEPDVGGAEWAYSPADKKWTGRIWVNLKAVDDELTVDKLTGFNLGVQDVDGPCDITGHARRGGKEPFYVLYEPYPHGAQDTARYAGIERVE